MTDTVEETQSEEGQTPQAEAPVDATPTEAAPKAVKSWKERIKQSVDNGAGNRRYQYFKDFFEREGDYEIDMATMSILLTLLNAVRASDEYKAWNETFKAETTAAGPKLVEPKTPDEIREFARKAQEQLARQRKAQESAEARAKRAAALLAQLEAEDADDDDEVDAPDNIEDDTPEDDAF
jgi:hypothetical protein